MYLKSLEVLGFKSFANRTSLAFEPGMTAIVGPNGCGKSNVLDCVRWILGEQSAKTLRGSKMEDFIFNGTDTRKPLGMAEASLTFSDCERALGVEYNEVTITRRVYRTGEGEYLINGTPCRLKDIQRLFMDTGIGTSSYSIMEQGRMDQILSSRPEDRREIFEEASGITKFKADRKEAIHKLDLTEANLLRLADVIREVKRQIGSLQRQAGKARRYQVLHGELRSLDLYATRLQLEAMDAELRTLEGHMTGVSDQLAAMQSDMADLESVNGRLRRLLSESDRRIDELVDARVSAAQKLDRSKDLIRVNTDRISEAVRQAELDAREIEQARDRIEKQRGALAETQASAQAAGQERDDSAGVLEERLHALTEHEQKTEQVRKLLDAARAEFVEMESAYSTLQNELIQVDARGRSEVIRRERLSVERSELERQAGEFRGRHEALGAELGALHADVDGLAAAAAESAARRTRSEQDAAALAAECAGLQSGISARRAEMELLEKDGAEATSLFNGKASSLRTDRSKILGSLVSRLGIDPDYAAAFRAAAGGWLEAVLVADEAAALAIMSELEALGGGPARLVAVEWPVRIPAVSALPNAERLLAHARCGPDVMAAAERLLGNVYVVPGLSAIPSPVPAGTVFVTRSGAIARGDGTFELPLPEGAASLPGARAGLLSELLRNVAGMESALAEKQTHLDAARAATEQARQELARAEGELQQRRHTLGMKEGAAGVVGQQVQQTEERLETVKWELGGIEKEDGASEGRRQDIAIRVDETVARRTRVHGEVEARSAEFRQLEAERARLASALMEARLQHSEAQQKAGFLDRQLGPMASRLSELEETASSRAEGMAARKDLAERLRAEMEQAAAGLEAMEAEVRRTAAQVEESRKERETTEVALAKSDADLATKRKAADELRDNKSRIEVSRAEFKLRRQNMIERVTGDYGVTSEDIAQSQMPQVEGAPAEASGDWLDTRVAELRAKIEAMGPVNLVAIEEHKELEERHDFLNKQQEDLVDSRQKLLAVINKINKTTSEMFAQTFAAANENFNSMFRKLFNGGSAKLVLVNEEDLLESGIEIIARPPGKKLQNVMLLSGGERALTALSLLFAIYMIKPSPFCILDELDAPLDESNIGRFISIVKDFLHQSQFVVITHNQRTISAADVIYGVTMGEERGVSRIVSMRFVERQTPADKAEAPQQAEPAKAAAAPQASTDETEAPQQEPAPTGA